MNKKELEKRIKELERENERLKAVVEAMEKWIEIMRPAPKPYAPIEPYTPFPNPWERDRTGNFWLEYKPYNICEI